MQMFTCPQCKAEVKKNNDDPIGCPCCGYAKEGVAPFYPAQPVQVPVYPSNPVWPNPPWYVGDPLPDITPHIDWGGTTTIKWNTSDTSNKVSINSGQTKA